MRVVGRANGARYRETSASSASAARNRSPDDSNPADKTQGLTMEAWKIATALLLPAAALSYRHSKLVSAACAVPMLVTLLVLQGMVDMSSEAHPLRFLVPLASMALAFVALIVESRAGRTKSRAAAMALLVFASGGGDVAALPTFRLLHEWAVPPLQICICVTLILISVWPKGWKEPWSCLLA